MDKADFEYYSSLEQDYWWYLGRRRIVDSLVRKFFKGTKKAFALDAGCGTGIFLNNLKEHATTVGIDRSRIALTHTKKRGHANLVCGDICELPFKDGSLDLVTTLGVLYNKDVVNDDSAIREAYRVLRKGGIMVVDEAAYAFLQSRHNVSVGGVRRYTRGQLIRKCEQSGFKVLKSSYWNVLMLPLFSLIVLLENFSAAKKQYGRMKRSPKIINSILKNYLYLEAFLLKYVNFPFGHSVVIVGEK